MKRRCSKWMADTGCLAKPDHGLVLMVVADAVALPQKTFPDFTLMDRRARHLSRCVTRPRSSSRSSGPIEDQFGIDGVVDHCDKRAKGASSPLTLQIGETLQAKLR